MTATLLAAGGCFTPAEIVAPPAQPPDARPADGPRDASARDDSGTAQDPPDGGPGADVGAPEAGLDAGRPRFDGGSSRDGSTPADSGAAADASGGAADSSVSPGCFRDESRRCVERLCDVNGWCWENPLPMGMQLSAVHGGDEANVWAVGNAGVALQFDGQDFVLHRPPSEKASTGVWVGGPDDVWMLSSDQVLRWDGQTWTSQRPGEAGAELSAIWGSSSSDLWIAGSTHSPGTYRRARAYHWDGAAWTEEALPAMGEARAMHGPSANDVWLVGGDEYPQPQVGRILRWSGSSWSESLVGQPPYRFDDVLGLSTYHAWVLDGVGAERWDAGGWTRIAAPGGAFFKRLTTVDGGLVATTADGAQYCLSGGAFASCGAVGFEVAALWPKVDPIFAVGAHGEVATPGPGGWARLLPTYSAATLLLNAPRGGASDDVWAFTWGGWPLHWDGSQWAEATDSPGQLWQAVSTGTGAHDLWVMALGKDSAGDVLLHHGSAWERLALPPWTGEYELFFHGLWAAAPGDLWIVGAQDSAGAIWRGDGTTWSLMPIPPTTELWRVWGTSATDVWVGSAQGEVLHWNGSAWARYPLDASFTHDLLGTRSDDVLVVTARPGGSSSSWPVFRWDGAQWNREHAFDNEIVYGLCTLGDEYWAVTHSSKVFHWDGSSWTSLTVGAERLSDCWVTPDRRVRVFGENGALLVRQY